VKRSVIALASGIGVCALTAAAAASLTVGGIVPQSGGTAEECQPEDITATAQVNPMPAWYITGVKVAGIDANCAGQVVQAVVQYGGGDGALKRASGISDPIPEEGGSVTVNITGTPILAVQVDKIYVVIAGQIVS
jgi:hypothetical protein